MAGLQINYLDFLQKVSDKSMDFEENSISFMSATTFLSASIYAGLPIRQRQFRMPRLRHLRNALILSLLLEPAALANQ